MTLLIEELDKIIQDLKNKNAKLKDKLSSSIRWADEERKGRERMRKLYAEKLEENTKLKEGVKEAIDSVEYGRGSLERDEFKSRVLENIESLLNESKC